MTRPTRADSYEAQLTEVQLGALHAALMSGRVKLETIQAESPKWRTGRFAGRPPSLASLSNIRDRLMLKASLTENAATTETLLEELKQEVPGITDEQLAEYGHRAFSLIALRQQDVKAWVALRRTQKDAGDLKLARQKFEVEVAKKLLDEATRARADEIARGSGTEAEKIEAMRRVYFADVDALAASGTIVLPPPA